jgi:hypothetical protein
MIRSGKNKIFGRIRSSTLLEKNEKFGKNFRKYPKKYSEEITIISQDPITT